MALKLITPATLFPVTLAEAKLQAQIDDTDRDALITALISAATAAAEQQLARPIMQQTFELTLDSFPDAIELTRVPVTAVTYLKYYDNTGVQQTLVNTAYRLNNTDDNGSAYLVPATGTSWPSIQSQFDAVTCRYVAGYADAASVPEPIKQWIKIAIRTMLEYPTSEIVERATLTTLGYVDRLLDPYRIWAQ